MSYKILCLVAPLKEFKWKFDWKAFHENYVKRNELSSWSFDFFLFFESKVHGSWFLFLYELQKQFFSSLTCIIIDYNGMNLIEKCLSEKKKKLYFWLSLGLVQYFYFCCQIRVVSEILVGIVYACNIQLASCFTLTC